MTAAVTLELRGALALVTMNRPERANVIDADSTAALAAIAIALGELVGAGTVRAVLLQAKGAQFCAGGDVAGMVRAVQAGPGQLAANMDRGIPALHDMIHRLATLPVPVVSAINGAVGGGGIGLALCADLVLASESMKLRGGYTAIGLSPDVGASWLLTRRVGAQRAKVILMTNKPVTAPQALALGLVCEVLPDADLPAYALALAEGLAAGATAALGRVKTLVDGDGPSAGRATDAGAPLHGGLRRRRRGGRGCGGVHGEEGGEVWGVADPPRIAVDFAHHFPAKGGTAAAAAR